MPGGELRQVDRPDIPAFARIPGRRVETEAYWKLRIADYLDCKLHPQQALRPRIIYVASEGNSLVGFIAGHLTRRHSCDGELEWINVIPERRASGIGSGLLRLLAAWFVRQKALRICVDVDPANTAAQRFYKQHGAEVLNEHWLIWSDINVVLGEC